MTSYPTDVFVALYSSKTQQPHFSIHAFSGLCTYRTERIHPPPPPPRPDFYKHFGRNKTKKITHCHSHGSFSRILFFFFLSVEIEAFLLTSFKASKSAPRGWIGLGWVGLWGDPTILHALSLSLFTWDVRTS